MAHNAVKQVAPVFLLCSLGFVNTFSIGAFPVLLPEISHAGGFGDFDLGLAAAAFGLARIFADTAVLLAPLTVTYLCTRETERQERAITGRWWARIAVAPIEQADGARLEITSSTEKLPGNLRRSPCARPPIAMIRSSRLLKA